MKRAAAIFCFFCFLLSSRAQEIVDTAGTQNLQHAYELPKEQWNDWKKLEENWRIKQYPKILKANKLKMNCSSCSYIYMDVIISIDTEGKLKYYKVLNSKKCAEPFSKALEIQFMKWFFAQKFPPTLYNTRFQTRLGTGLKC